MNEDKQIKQLFQENKLDFYSKELEVQVMEQIQKIEVYKLRKRKYTRIFKFTFMILLLLVLLYCLSFIQASSASSYNMLYMLIGSPIILYFLYLTLEVRRP